MEGSTGTSVRLYLMKMEKDSSRIKNQDPGAG
jgi:hypothetical protein